MDWYYIPWNRYNIVCIISSTVKYSWFVVTGLKLAKSLVWSLNNSDSYSTLNQSDRLSSAFKHHTGQSGSPSPADSDQGGAQMLSPQEKGSNSWSYLIISYPEYYASQHYTPKQDHTRYVIIIIIFFISNCRSLPCSTGKQFMRLTSCLSKLHKCYITIIGFSTRE